MEWLGLGLVIIFLPLLFSALNEGGHIKPPKINLPTKSKKPKGDTHE